jgi:hypothetical protein
MLEQTHFAPSDPSMQGFADPKVKCGQKVSKVPKQGLFPGQNQNSSFWYGLGLQKPKFGREPKKWDRKKKSVSWLDQLVEGVHRS